VSALTAAPSLLPNNMKIDKMKNDTQMAIAVALPTFIDLGRSVTPPFLSQNRFYLQLSPHCKNMNKQQVWEVKTISRFRV